MAEILGNGLHFRPQFHQQSVSRIHSGQSLGPDIRGERFHASTRFAYGQVESHQDAGLNHHGKGGQTDKRDKKVHIFHKCDSAIPRCTVTRAVQTSITDSSELCPPS